QDAGGAAGQGNQAAQGPDEGRLPRAVRTEQAEHLSGPDAQAHTVHRRERAESNRHVAKVQGLFECESPALGTLHPGPGRPRALAPLHHCVHGSALSGMTTSAAMPDLKMPSGSATRTLMPKT